jgi:sortase A
MSLRTRQALIVALAAVGVWQASAGLYIHAKAWLAQRLIAASWASTLEGERQVRPWPWADTWPVARLRVPSAAIDLYVLADASGRSLAFGPGFMSESAAPGSIGNTVIAAHRDTHFRFLQTLPVGSEIILQTQDAAEHRYHVMETDVIDARHDSLQLDAEQPMLTLLTCYPFEQIVPGGPLRYVAVATGS